MYNCECYLVIVIFIVLLNSLDAKATKIEVYTDIPNSSIKIVDNGTA